MRSADAAANQSTSGDFTFTTAGSLHVESIAMGIVKVGRQWEATAAVLVQDAAGAPLPGAVVTGNWYLRSNTIQRDATAATEGTGTASFTSPGKNAKSGWVFTFAVTGVTLSGYDYVPGTVTQGSIAVP